MEVFFTNPSSSNFTLFEKKRQATVVIPPQKLLLAKRAFDIIFAALVTLLLLSWIVPIIILIIKVESRGPAFFKQLRTGKDGQSFYCFKFRSMTVNSSADTQQATKGDARITRVGAFLRKTSLDELPQFINVLKGEMSVVGPRPHMLLHTEHYAKTIHNFGERHRVLPGITGLAQVSGLRGETKEADAMVKRVKADIHYLENWSLWLDFKIILSTVKQVVVSSEEAC
jgi:putative colanic acid biosynthesis UDP-glucose lipid carrier transferase